MRCWLACVAVVVLWPNSSNSPETATATFIVFAGQLSPAGTYQISAIVFGDPLSP